MVGGDEDVIGPQPRDAAGDALGHVDQAERPVLVGGEHALGLDAGDGDGLAAVVEHDGARRMRSPRDAAIPRSERLERDPTVAQAVAAEGDDARRRDVAVGGTDEIRRHLHRSENAGSSAARPLRVPMNDSEYVCVSPGRALVSMKRPGRGDSRPTTTPSRRNSTALTRNPRTAGRCWLHCTRTVRSTIATRCSLTGAVLFASAADGSSATARDTARTTPARRMTNV